MNKVYADESLDISKEGFEKPQYLDVELDCRNAGSNSGNPFDDMEGDSGFND